MNITIRPAAAADIEALIALSRQTISTSYRPFLGDAAVDAFINKSGAVELEVEQNLERCTVILYDSRIVGYAVCTGASIHTLLIDPQQQRRGLGTVLLQHCEEQVFRQFDTLSLGELREQSAGQSLLPEKRVD